MLLLKAKYLESRELPDKPPYPKSYLVSLLVGSESMTLIAKAEAIDELAGVEMLDDVELSVSTREVNLAELGGRGKAYRLVVEAVDPGVDS